MSESLTALRNRYQARWSEEALEDLPKEARELLTRLDVGDLRLAIEDLWVFTEKQSRKRAKVVRKQLARERKELAEADECPCSGTGHKTTRDCLKRLDKLEPVITSLVPVMGPRDVYDFVYFVAEGRWEGRAGVWYQNFPICELLMGPPVHANAEALGAHLLKVASAQDERVV